MKKRTRIIVIVIVICVVIPTVVVPVYFYGINDIRPAVVESIIIDSVTDAENIGLGPDRSFNCIVNISFVSPTTCDSLNGVTIKVDESSMKATISIYMKVSRQCMIPALYSGMISLSVILIYYGDWTISCNNFNIELDISDYLLI